MEHYNAPEIEAVGAAVIVAAKTLGITATDVLVIVAQKFGEKIAQPTGREELLRVAAELGIDLG